MSVTAVFDFDKTIVSKDTGFEFIRHFTYQSPLRTAAALTLWPFAILLMLAPPVRHWGISICTWISTFPCKAADFDRVREEFLRAFWGRRGAKVYGDALEKLRWHQAQGHRILVISGSPTSLVQAVLSDLQVEGVDLVGSSDALFMGGVICPAHCIGKNKLTMAFAAGHDPAHWDYGYSDSSLDIPLLGQCKKRFVVNPKKVTLARYRRHFGDEFEVLRWR